MVLGGALADPADGAVIVFASDGPAEAEAEAFAQTDPDVCNGPVKTWRVREWRTVVGREAATAL